ncbi:MAG: ABC transporter substrate-binding protein [Candidatus Rokuibacteriota bacterium]
MVAAFFAVGGMLAAPIAAAEDGVTADTVVIGAYGPLTGPAAYIGLGGRDGMALAAKEVNDAGGIHGRKLKVVFEDDGFSPTRALAAVKKLVEQDKAFMIFGVSGSNPTVGTLEYLRGLKVPNYVSFASAPQVTRPFSKYFFRGGTTEAARYGELYAEFITQFLQAKRIAILSGSDEFPKNEGDATERLLDQWYGIKPVLRVEFKVGDKDFTPQLLKIKEANPEVFMTLGHVTEASIIVRQARELGLRQPIFGSGAMVDNALIANAGWAAEGFMGGWLTGVFLDSLHPDMVKFKDGWSKLNPGAPKGRPNVFDVLAYSDLQVVAEGLRRAGKDLTRDGLVKALESLKDYRISEIATPRTFTDWHHIGNLRMQMMVVINQHWVPLRWDPAQESGILADYKKK